jgi:ribonuclease BN (tRNA processing enzyme)
MQVTFLGTGDAFASGGRHSMAILLRSEGLGVLLDCGPSTLPALKKQGLSPSDIDVILLSHHHGDHFAGVPFVVLHECYQGPRNKPLHVFGPNETQSKIAQSLELFYPGLAPTPFKFTCRDLDPDETFTLGAMSATPFEADHFSGGTAFGYRVELGGKCVVFSGDTAWTDELARQSSGADLFICECSGFDTPIDKHMSHHELVAQRASIEAKRTVLVHAGVDVLRHEPELVFELAHDGMEVEL